jgi:hypothetical protein
MSNTGLLGETPEGVMRQNVMKDEFGWEVPVEAIPLPSRGSIYDPDSLLHNTETLKIKSMTAHEEDILASPAFHKEGTVMSHLISSCLVDKQIDPDDMILGDRISLMVGIRTLGINRLKIKPVQEGRNEFEFVLPVTKKKVTFKYLTGRDERNRAQTAKNRARVLGSKIENNVTSYLENVILSVDGVTDPLKIKHFIKNMPAFDSRKIRNFILSNEPGIDMTHKMTCQNVSCFRCIWV